MEQTSPTKVYPCITDDQRKRATAMATIPGRARRWLAVAILAASTHALAATVPAVEGNAQRSATLVARYHALKGELADNPFHRPLHMASNEGADSVSGEVLALVNYPMADAAAALREPAQWCELMILHLNTKYCRPSPDGATLRVNIGKKYDQPLDQAYRFDFAFHLAANTPDYLLVNLAAGAGPFGTSDYRIQLEAAPVESGKTVIRFSYAYSFGTVGRWAMQAYLATAGRSKVGFTVTGRDDTGAPIYIGGTRGVVERNTMRYYLAVEARLGALALAPAARMEQSLHDWFASIERYPRQLHEMERGEYLTMKRLEIARQLDMRVASAANRPGG